MTILTVGIDLAKKVFSVHRVNEAGKADQVRPAVPREQLTALVAALQPWVIGVEACPGAHHWARQFEALGHLRLIAPKFVTPYRMSSKGIVLPLNAATVRRRACDYLEDLPGYANTVIGDLLSEVTRLDERITQWRQYADPQLAPIWRSVTPTVTSPSTTRSSKSSPASKTTPGKTMEVIEIARHDLH